jgi:predicted helicase
MANIIRFRTRHLLRGVVVQQPNDRIILIGIAGRAWDYMVDGKVALDWVMARQPVREDKASDIVNDANDLATETVGKSRYPLELFQRVVTISLETLKIFCALLVLDIHPLDSRESA